MKYPCGGGAVNFFLNDDSDHISRVQLRPMIPCHTVARGEPLQGRWKEESPLFRDAHLLNHGQFTLDDFEDNHGLFHGSILL